jgi:hypothetical protein
MSKSLKPKTNAGYIMIPCPTASPIPYNASTGKADTTYYNNPNYNFGRQMIIDWQHFVHSHTIILNRWFFWTDPRAREGVALFHEFQKANIYKVAASIATKTPRFVRPSEEENFDPEIADTDEPITTFWEEHNLTSMLRQFIEEDRKHGWALYYPYNIEELPTYFTGNPFHVYSVLEATEMEDKRDKWGHPTQWDIKPINSKLESFKLSIIDCVFFNSAQSNDYKGVPEGLDCWDDLIDYIFIKEAMKSFDQRMGNGFMFIPIDENASPAEEANVQTKIKNVRTEMGLTYRQSKDNPLKPEWMEPTPGVNFVEHLTKYEEMFATGMGFPVRWLKGDPHGAVESGQSDTAEVQARLREIFTKYEAFVKRVLIFHELISTPDEILILPSLGVNMSEQEQAELANMKATTIGIKSWLTTDEKRIEDGYEETDEETQADAEMNAMSTQNEDRSTRSQSRKAKLSEGSKGDSEMGDYHPELELFRCPYCHHTWKRDVNVQYNFDGLLIAKCPFCSKPFSFKEYWTKTDSKHVCADCGKPADYLVKTKASFSSSGNQLTDDEILYYCEEDFKIFKHGFENSIVVAQKLKKIDSIDNRWDMDFATTEKFMTEIKRILNELQIPLQRGSDAVREYVYSYVLHKCKDIKDIRTYVAQALSTFKTNIKSGQHYDAGNIQELFTSIPVRQLAEETGLSTTTISKVRAKFDKDSLTMKCDAYDLKSDSIDGNILTVEGPFLAPHDNLQYADSSIPDVRSKAEITKWFQSNTPKELHIGITPSDDHPTKVPLEVLAENSVGTVRAERVLEDGSILGSYKIDLDKIDLMLGKENWVREYIRDKKKLPVSVALWSKDKIKDGKRLNTNLDVRSVVLTRHPRNEKTYGKE